MRNDWRETEEIMSQTIEGTWEEIAARAGELRGKRLRVTVLESPKNSKYDGMTVAEMFEGRTGVVEFEPDDVAEKAEEYFGQIIEEKHREGKLCPFAILRH